MKDQDKIMDKIKKCLALSNSSNQHEAAIALAMAQKLMKEYNLSQTDIAETEITEAKTQSTFRKAPQEWENDLINLIKVAFGVEIIINHFTYRKSYRKSDWVFIGHNPNAQIAAYAAKVLIRQIKRLRNDFLNTWPQTKLKYSKTKIERANVFCRGIVEGLSDKIEAFAPTRQQTSQIEAYYNRKYGDLETCNTRIDNGTADNNKAYIRGLEAANTINLHHGVNGKAEQQLKLC